MAAAQGSSARRWWWRAVPVAVLAVGLALVPGPRAAPGARPAATDRTGPQVLHASVLVERGGGPLITPMDLVACTDRAYRVTGRRISPYGFEWSYDPRGEPGEVRGRAMGAIEAAGSVWATGANDCGLSLPMPRLRLQLMGETPIAPEVSVDGRCTGNDGISVMGFAPVRDPSVLAVLCTYSVDGVVVGSDLVLNSLRRWTTQPGPGCTDAYDVESVAVHELGHALGLDDLDELRHGALTMSGGIDACSAAARTLGLGDLVGLRTVYLGDR